MSTDTKIKAPKEPDDSSLMIKGKGGKGESKGKGRAKGQTTWTDASQWPTPWSSPVQHPTAPYSNWTPPAKGKGNGKVDPATLWCDIHQMHGHSTEWCFDNPYRSGGPPIPPSRSWWCDSCNSYGHTSDNCWAKSPSPNTKGKGQTSTPKGKGNKGRQGDRKWKSPNFPAAYSTDQATPALHDESPSKSTPDEWWEGKEIGSSCFDEVDNNEQANDFVGEYDDAELAEEIDFYFLAIIQNLERQKEYLLAPTAEKLITFNWHEETLVLATSQLNIHSQRIVRTFRTQLGYVGCMETFLAQHRSLEESQVPTKPAIDTATDIEIPSHLSSEVDTCRNDGIPAIASSGFGPRDRDISADPLLEGGLVLDLAGQASPEDKANVIATLSSTSAINATTLNTLQNTDNPALLDHQLESQLRDRQVQNFLRRLKVDIRTHLTRENDIATVKALLARETFIPKMKFTLEIHSHSHNGVPNEPIQTLLNEYLLLPLHFNFEIIIDAHIQRDFSINTIQRILERQLASQLSITLGARPSYFSTRDRENCVDPLLENESYSVFAGQASADSTDESTTIVASAFQATYLYAQMLLCDLDAEIQVNLKTAVEIKLDFDASDRNAIVDNTLDAFEANILGGIKTPLKDELASLDAKFPMNEFGIAPAVAKDENKMDATEVNIHGGIESHLANALASLDANIPKNEFGIAPAVAKDENKMDATEVNTHGGIESHLANALASLYANIPMNEIGIAPAVTKDENQMDATEANILGGTEMHLESALVSHEASVPVKEYTNDLATAVQANELDATAVNIHDGKLKNLVDEFASLRANVLLNGKANDPTNANEVNEIDATAVNIHDGKDMNLVDEFASLRSNVLLNGKANDRANVLLNGKANDLTNANEVNEIDATAANIHDGKDMNLVDESAPLRANVLLNGKANDLTNANEVNEIEATAVNIHDGNAMNLVDECTSLGTNVLLNAMANDLLVANAVNELTIEVDLTNAFKENLEKGRALNARIVNLAPALNETLEHELHDDLEIAKHSNARNNIIAHGHELTANLDYHINASHEYEAIIRRDILAPKTKTANYLASDQAPPCIGPRDRDISANLLLAGGLVPDLAGQASPKCMDTSNTSSKENNLSLDFGNDITLSHNDPDQQEFLNQLQRTINNENAELATMEMHLQDASDIIMMLQESSQT